MLYRELSAYTEKKDIISLIYHILLVQGFQANILYRISNLFYRNKMKLIGKIIARLNFAITNVDIPCSVSIGERLFLPHTQGIVIGSTSKIGRNVTILHGVTIGSSKIVKDSKEGRHPVIGDNVVIGPNSCILGQIKISDNTKIKALSLVYEDV